MTNKVPSDDEAVGSHGPFKVFRLQDTFPKHLTLYIVLKKLFEFFFLNWVPRKGIGWYL